MSSEKKLKNSNRLFHYTDWNGLQGILEKQTLWATHFRYLNDETESHYGITRFEEDFVSFIKATHPANVAEELKKTFVPKLFNKQIADVYVASLSSVSSDEVARDGLLSQWRGYGKNGGFAVEFRRDDLVSRINKERKEYAYLSLQLTKVNYGVVSRSTKKLHLVNVVKLLDYMRSSSGKAVPRDILRPAFKAVLHYLAYIKHSGFKEEKEVRITAIVNSRERLEKIIEEGKTHGPEKKIHFRSEAIPYLKLFESASEQKKSLPIERIIVGPHKDKEKRVKALELMLRDTDITVVASGIPYIG